MPDFPRCDHCEVRGRCIVQEAGHRPYCDWMKRGGRYRDRVIELSADLNAVAGDSSGDGLVVASVSGDVPPQTSDAPRGIRTVTPTLTTRMPSPARQVANVAGAIGRVVVAAAKGQAVMISDEERARRLEICHGCDQYDAPRDRCRACGCVGRWKASLKTEGCPLSKW